MQQLLKAGDLVIINEPDVYGGCIGVIVVPPTRLDKGMFMVETDVGKIVRSRDKLTATTIDDVANMYNWVLTAATKYKLWRENHWQGEPNA